MRALIITVFGIIALFSTFIRDVNCQHFCFSCNLSVFGSQFNLHIFWNCVNLICTPVNSLVKKNSLFIWLIDIFGAHFRKQCSKQSSLSSYVKNFFVSSLYIYHFNFTFQPELQSHPNHDVQPNHIFQTQQKI